MKIVDAFCVFLPLDGRCNNNRRRCETKSQVLLLTLELEGVKFCNCVKQQNEDEKKIKHLYLKYGNIARCCLKKKKNKFNLTCN